MPIFAGASARAIAREGSFNQALIFYHFASVRNLLLAVLDLISERRMSEYRPPFERARARCGGGESEERLNMEKNQAGSAQTHELNGKTIAILATDGFEQIELEQPQQLLEQAGARTVIVSLKAGKIQGFKHHDKADQFAAGNTGDLTGA